MPTLRYSVFGQIVFYTVFSLFVWGAISVLLPHRNISRQSLKNVCINNLRLIDGAKQQWAMKNNKTNSDVPAWSELQSYLGRPGDALPKCPSAGIYTLGAINNLPTCSIPGHVLR